jgi:hypothetical protein
MLRLAGGIVLAMVATFMAIGFLAGGAADHTLGVRIAAALISVGIPAAGSVALLRQHLARRALPPPSAVFELPRERWTSELIKLAARHGGRLTVVEAVAESSLTPEEVQAAFDELCAQSVAELQMTESGLVVYAFRDILLLGEKHASRGLLES